MTITNEGDELQKVINQTMFCSESESIHRAIGPIYSIVYTLLWLDSSLLAGYAHSYMSTSHALMNWTFCRNQNMDKKLHTIRDLKKKTGWKAQLHRSLEEYILINILHYISLTEKSQANLWLLKVTLSQHGLPEHPQIGWRNCITGNFTVWDFEDASLSDALKHPHFQRLHEERICHLWEVFNHPGQNQ